MRKPFVTIAERGLKAAPALTAHGPSAATLSYRRTIAPGPTIPGRGWQETRLPGPGLRCRGDSDSRSVPIKWVSASRATRRRDRLVSVCKCSDYMSRFKTDSSSPLTDLAEKVVEILSILPDRERQVLHLRYGL